MLVGIQVNCTLTAILLLLGPESGDSKTTASPTHHEVARSAGAVSPETGPARSHRGKARRRDLREQCAAQTATLSGPSSFAWPNADSLLSPEVRDWLSAEPWSLKKSGGARARFLGDPRRSPRHSQRHGDHGGVIGKHRRVGASKEEITRIACNDRVDAAEQIERKSNAGCRQPNSISAPAIIAAS